MSDSVSVGPGTVLADRYKLTKLIGRGGFGEVYEATQLNMDRVVAVKILPAQFMSVYDVVARFKREAKLASRLRHPNTITLHDYGQHGDNLFIVMELLQGEDLADVLKTEGKIPIERIFRIATGILKSLSEAHRNGVVHRDLKPENIFLSVVGDDTDYIKVLDFGIAKLALPELEAHPDAERKLTLAGSTVGTPAYMSPEQAAGEEVDGQTDLYALGIMMYEMANGKAPFHDKDLVKVMRSHLFEPIPRLKNPELHGTLFEKVVMKALEKERVNRFKTASEFLLAMAGGPVVQPLIHGLPQLADMPRKVKKPLKEKEPPADLKEPPVVLSEKSDQKRTRDQSPIIQVIQSFDDEGRIYPGLEEPSGPAILLTKKKAVHPKPGISVSKKESESPGKDIFTNDATSKSPQEWAFDEERNDALGKQKQPEWLIPAIFVGIAVVLAAAIALSVWS